MPPRSIVLVEIFLVFGPAPCARADADPHAKPIRVRLTCTTARFDPHAPGDHRVTCTVRNSSDRVVEIPTVYIAGFAPDLRLTAGGNPWDLTLVAWAGPKEQRLKALPPGEETVVFQDTLRNLLLLDAKGANAPPLIPGQKRYYWSWRA